ncbi:MAG: efflux RND transporter periplasmic adaptor subunit [Planctomycetota bacterium]
MLGRWSQLCLLVLVSACEGDHEADEHGHEEEGIEHADEVRLTAEALAAHGIRIDTATRRVLVPTLRVPAQVAFNGDGIAHVGVPVRGRVAKLAVRLGDEVAPGAVLLEIESPELGEAQGDYVLKRSIATNGAPGVELARGAYERARALHEKNQGIALSEVLKREAELRTVEAAWLTTQAEEEAAENRLLLFGMSSAEIAQLAETRVLDPVFTVRARAGGQVVERRVTLGELVGPERDALLVIADMAKLWVLADVPEGRLAELALGARARVLLGSSDDHWCEGVLSFVSPSINPATRTVQVRIEPTDRHPELRPGVFAQVELEARGTSEPLAVLAVPDTALQRVEGAPAVFVPVAGEPGTFALRVVRVGPTTNGQVPVLAGLEEGEAYVSVGSFILKAELGKASAEHDH